MIVGDGKTPCSLLQTTMDPVVSTYSSLFNMSIDHSGKTFFCSFPVDRGMLELKRTTDYGKSFKTIANKIFSFGLGGKFLFASVMTGKVSVQLCIF